MSDVRVHNFQKNKPDDRFIALLNATRFIIHLLCNIIGISAMKRGIIYLPFNASTTDMKSAFERHYNKRGFLIARLI